MQKNVDIPPGSTVLITGANGLIAANIAEEFLALGYNVVGTVRSTTRCAWLSTFFSDRAAGSPHRGAFTLAELQDLQYEAAYASLFATHDIASVILTTSAMAFGQTQPEPFIARAVETVLAPMRAAAAAATTTKPSGVKSFVLTGSAWSAFTPRADDPRALTAATFNEEAVRAAYAGAWEDDGARGLAILMAAFVAKDRAARRFVEEERPPFRASVLLVDSVFGRVLDVEKQGLPTTVGFLAGIWGGGEGAKMARAFIKPQWHVDAADLGRLHVAAAVRADVVNERIYAFGEPFTWNKVLKIMRKKWPQKTFDEEDPSEGESVTKVPNERGAELLRDMGGKGWTTLEESVVQTVETAKLA